MLLGFTLFLKLEMKKHYFSSCLQKDISQIHFKMLTTATIFVVGEPVISSIFFFISVLIHFIIS